MSKERFLTVLIPIKDSDCEATVYNDLAELQTAIPASESNINKIYIVKGVGYCRSYYNGTAYDYRTVVDREFPYIGQPLEICDFTYNATRMGNAPTISAQGVMRYADKDGSGEDITLDGLWTQMCHVVFNGMKLYLKQIPTSSKDNEDARYKYDMDFVDETVILERVYLYDIVSPFISDKPVSDNSKFSFFGDIQMLADRINANFIRSGLSTLTRKYVAYPNIPSKTVPYLSYEQWSNLLVNPFPLIDSAVFEDYAEMVNFRTFVYLPLNGDYNLYLQTYIYENTSGVYTMSGYQCVIGTDKHGNQTTSEEKLVSFEDAYIKDALQQFKDTFELQYYITREKDGSGNFTGNIFVVVGDCEYDFADIDVLTGDYVRDADGIPTTETPFDYGVDDEFLSKTKTNTTEKIVSRITGVGSSENIPWYYPNPNPDGWIKPFYTRLGVEQQGVTIDYPIDVGNTSSDYARYEKFLKNRVGISIKRGNIRHVAFANNTSFFAPVDGGQYVSYEIDTTGVQNPRITLELDYNPSASKCNRFVAVLNKGGDAIDTYDSAETYSTPSDFQMMFITKDGKHATNLLINQVYRLEIAYYIPSNQMPLSRRFDYEGYHYPSQIVYTTSQPVFAAYAAENFYNEKGLLPFLRWQSGDTMIYIYEAGYSSNGESSGKIVPMSRSKGKQYKDITTGTIYRCTESLQPSSPDEYMNGTYTEGFEENPVMSYDEWFRTFVNMTLKLYSNYGWYIGNTYVYLEDYGLTSPSGVSPDIFDAIEFQRLKWVTPQPNLLPEVYIKTDGERRFYNAKNYWDADNSRLIYGIADTAVGEERVGGLLTPPPYQVRNNIYKEEETDPDNEHYQFENEYVQSMPHEHIENFDDIKPTIKEQTNTVNGSVIRIDVVEMFEYDLTDNDEIWEDSSYGSVQGEYKHPYFFAKLRPLGFNIFDMALQEDMVLSMTTGNCGACNFKIGVDENSKKNPVQLWEYDVYRGDDLLPSNLLYEAGTLRRYVDLTGLYYDTPNGAVSIIDTDGVLKGQSPFGYAESVPMYNAYNYTADAVKNGYVGTMKQRGALHFEGDVVTDGKFIESQQDTSENYVWVALMKDTESYGTIMPSARPNYNSPNLNQYIEPKGINFIDRRDGSVTVLTEEQADNFVFTNIRMPQVYLRRAEHELSRKLVKYMYEHNYQMFNFSIKFSRIYIDDNPQTDDSLNENSVLYVKYDGNTYRQYVKHYTYKMESGKPLPEISVDMNEELSVTKTISQRWDEMAKRNNSRMTSSFNSQMRQMQNRIDKTTIKKDGTYVFQGNIIVDGENTSLIEMARNQYQGGEGGGGVLEWGEF